MDLPTIVFYGPNDLRSLVLSAYFARLHCPFRVTQRLYDLIHTAHQSPRTLFILAEDQPAPVLVRQARALIPDLARPRPPIFILNSGEPFEPHLPAVTVLSGPHQFSLLANRLLEVLRNSTGVQFDLPRIRVDEWETFQAARPDGTDPDALLHYSVLLRARLRSTRARAREVKSRARETQDAASALRVSCVTARFHAQELISSASGIIAKSHHLHVAASSTPLSPASIAPLSSP